MAKSTKTLSKVSQRVMVDAFASMRPAMITCSCGARLRVQFLGLQGDIARQFVKRHWRHNEISVIAVGSASSHRRRSLVGEHPF